MSISRGRYVATFAKPGHEIGGMPSIAPNDYWRVFINQRIRFSLVFMNGSGNFERFRTFEKAKAWAIARLDELTSERI